MIAASEEQLAADRLRRGKGVYEAFNKNTPSHTL